MTPVPPPLPVGSLLGNKYRLDALLGQGGMGAVYLAENVDIGRKVAVKVLLPEIAADAEALARFKTEARAAAAIGHPNIAEVIDYGTTAEGGAFLVMEYLQGETLGARLRRGGPLEVEVVGWIADELLAAVAAAHATGVIHRDLKPDNVFLVEQPVRAVKVLDFGVSKFHEKGQASLTRTGVVMGTPAYMSPEQARGAKDVGPASDLYAVGAVLYESLAGAPAFRGDSYNEILAKVLTEPHAPLSALRPGLPAPVVAAIDRLLAKAVAERPADAQQARILLAEAFGTAGASSSLGPSTIRPGGAPISSPGFAPTMPRTPPARPSSPSSARPTAPASTPPPAGPPIPAPFAGLPLPPPPPPPPPPPFVAAAAAAGLPPGRPPPQAQAGEAPRKKKKGVMRWVFLAFLVFLGFRACRGCSSCLEEAAGPVRSVGFSTYTDDAGKTQVGMELRFADGGTTRIDDVTKIPDLDKLGPPAHRLRVPPPPFDSPDAGVDEEAAAPDPENPRTRVEDVKRRERAIFKRELRRERRQAAPTSTPTP